ncbi:MAG: hypothetical protein R2795_19905 [Saprospiraceae bacterium]
MKKHFISTGILLLSLFSTLLIQGQTSSSSMLVKLENSVNNNAIKRSSHLRPAKEGGTFDVGTWGDAEFSKAMVTKITADLEVEWSFRLNVSINNGFTWQTSYGADVYELQNGDIILLAAINTGLFNTPTLQNLDYGVIKIRPGQTPQVLSAHYFGGNFSDIPQGLIATQDGGYLLHGITNMEQALNTPSFLKTYMVKLDADLNLVWQKLITPSNALCRTDALILYNQGMVNRTAIETSDGGIVFTCQCQPNAFIGKLDAAGEFLWGRQFENAGGFLEGASGDDWGLIVGSGGYGAINRMQELPDGRLAFLGNHVFYLFGIFGIALPNQNDGFGEGTGLPLSYLLVTDAAGNFQYGTAFFQETFAQPNMPIEMMVDDFVHVEDNRFLFVGGTNRHVTGGVTSYAPFVVEMDAQIHEVDEGIRNAYFVGADDDVVFRHTKNDYPWGLDRIHTLKKEDNDRLLLAYDNQVLQMTPIDGFEQFGDCIEPASLSPLHSIPLNITFTNNQITTMSLPVGSPLTFSLTPINAYTTLVLF